MDLIDTIIFPLKWFVAFVMVGFHQLFTAIGMPEASGWTWTLSIVGLVIVLRILLIPLFVKQIKSSRRMQLIQPEMQKIQAKYKGKKDPESRQKQTEEVMELYKRTGTNPFASCMPILLQSPFFFALFRVLQSLPEVASGSRPPIGPLSQQLASQAESSTVFGAQLSSSFLNSTGAASKFVTMVLIVLMSLSQFFTQRQLMTKNMPVAALENPYAKQQKLIMYAMPLVFFVTGPSLPIGVLIYWLTTNLWSMGQQFYTIRRMPAPGSAAEKALEERNRAKGKVTKKDIVPGLKSAGGTGSSVAAEESAPEPVSPGRATAAGGTAGQGGGQRVQPKRNKKRKR